MKVAINQLRKIIRETIAECYGWPVEKEEHLYGVAVSKKAAPKDTKNPALQMPKGPNTRGAVGEGISIGQLRALVREITEETVKEADKDLNKDGENDFEDVMIARMKASGMDHDKAVEKGEKAAKKAEKKTQSA